MGVSTARGIRWVLPAVLCCLANGLAFTTPTVQGQEKSDTAVPPADLVIVGAKVWTGLPAADHKPDEAGEPTALAVIGDTIVAVGTDDAIRSRVGPNTKVIEARGRRMIPGITDSHTHIIGGGLQLDRLSLRDVRNREEFVRAVAEAAKKKKPGEWLTGGRWSVESWDNPEPPRAAWLDPVTGDIPVCLERMDGHQSLVNSAALRLAGIDASGPADPVGGEIERHPTTREPTGILKESAADLVSRLIPAPAPAERYEALLRAMKHANSLGITSVHDMCEPADLEVFRRANTEGVLTVRITAYLSDPNWSAHLDAAAQSRYGLDDKMVRLAGFKGYADGSLGSRTAFMRAPYTDAPPEAPHPRGQLTAMADSPPAFRKEVAAVDARGLQLAIHAIGDEANHLVLGAYEVASRVNGFREARHRIEHAQHLLLPDIPRFAQIGVVASMQPFHKSDDGRYCEKAIGKDRLVGSYAFRQLLDAGALLVFGSDWPVVTLNPFAGIDAAVNAKTLDGRVWLPSHSLTLEEALRSYTVLPPWAIHQETRLGSLEVGKLADVVILRDDLLSVSADRLVEVKVAQTIVGGKIVYTAPE